MNIHRFFRARPNEMADIVSGPINPMSRSDRGYQLRIKTEDGSYIVSLEPDEVKKLVCWHEGRRM